MTKILIVDDSEDVLEILTLILEKQGYDVDTASSKNKALTQLSTFIPDVILLDTMLHGDNGRELCKEIKQKNSLKYIPIILLSVGADYLKDYEECEAVDVIEKPFNLNTVIQKVEGALSYQTS